jgi:MATE family multidrug resistance protein
VRAAVPGDAAPLGARRILAIALPVVLSNVTSPLQGAIDTAVIGSLGSTTMLAATGLGAQMFALLFGVFNFLQIGSSGLSAQALGAGDRARVIETLARALVVAALIAAALILARGALVAGGLALFEASGEAEALAGEYFAVRIWGAPAELGLYALFGWFSGQELTRRLVQLQVFACAVNVALNLMFVFGFGWDVAGVAAATAAASWAALLLGLWLARGRAAALAPPGWRLRARAVLARGELMRVMALNRDIFLRTLALIGSFAWMTRLGALQGDAVLAANVVLFHMFEMAAYALDGFAIAAETLVGQAMGARDRRALRRAAVATSAWSFGLAAVISGALLAMEGPFIDLFTTSPEIRALAREFAPWAALTPLAGVAAFQLDGVFVGATAAREMRDAMLASAAVYLPVSLGLAALFGNHGVWAALILLLLLRAGALLALYPRLEARASV